MEYITNEKLTIIGGAGMIGSNLAQCILMQKLTSHICLCDPFSPHGVAEELRHCGFTDATIEYTTDIAEALTGASYVISSGAAPRKAGQTREDQLFGNVEIAKDLGENIKRYCPDVKHVLIIFNPTDMTGLTTLVYSGIDPHRITTLAALDTTRLISEISHSFNVPMSDIGGCATYGGHGEKMAIFTSGLCLKGQKVSELKVSEETKQKVVQGGANIISLRGRSSFQSPAFLAAEQIGAAMGGPAFKYPVGAYINDAKYSHIMMGLKTFITAEGVFATIPSGDDEEMKALDESYAHLCKMRDELISVGLLPPIEKWHEFNKHLL